ncbi:uncharacterized protein LOC120933498 [Rana temporaria]|uniref:uncharacterized protein LOC120933498 n=1 Tax=Rana temporaria TaxID=8407 RepID=UPI001AAE1386|nr:uncharacterized protein LOC120933498 [Rana temporaria]
MPDKFTSPDFLSQFIEMYRQLPCLWQVKSKDYSNRDKKHEALSKLVELCKAVCPNPTIDYVRNKIANIRTVFKKELNKVRVSQTSGAGTDEIYEPRLWYYESLRFLTDQVEARASVCSLSGTSAASPNSEDEEQDNVEDLPISQLLQEQESQEDMFTSRPALPPLARKKKRSLDSATCSFLDKAASALQNKSDESDGFGVMIANKHRKMTDQQREFAERLVLEVLAKGIRGELSAKTKLIEEQPPTTYQAPMHFAQTQASNHQTGQWQYPSGQVHSSPWGPTYTNI